MRIVHCLVNMLLVSQCFDQPEIDGKETDSTRQTVMRHHWDELQQLSSRNEMRAFGCWFTVTSPNQVSSFMVFAFANLFVRNPSAASLLSTVGAFQVFFCLTCLNQHVIVSLWFRITPHMTFWNNVTPQRCHSDYLPFLFYSCMVYFWNCRHGYDWLEHHRCVSDHKREN